MSGKCGGDPNIDIPLLSQKELDIARDKKTRPNCLCC
jgi:hypothetical protein